MSSHTINTDYLVVGAGAVGMAFVDSLVDHCDADVVIVDRRHRPGGHWLDSYPFVRLHQPSRFYGLNSTALGHDVNPVDGPGMRGRAMGTEICTYYDDALRRWEASGRVRFFPMSDYLGHASFCSRLNGEQTDVRVRTRVVDATYLASRVPATDPAPFEMAAGVRCVPIGDLARIEGAPAGYVIVGAGKTALDAICWLIDHRASPDDITWIRPRDIWLLNRAWFQPGTIRTLQGVVVLLEAMAEANSVDEVYARLEEADLVLRTDRNVVPTMMRGATISRAELAQLAQIRNIVRLGHVQRIEPDRIVLEHGVVPTTLDHLHVHCAAPGLNDNPLRPIFTSDVITLQLVTRVAMTLSGALIGYVESTGRTTEEKNALCRPTGLPHTPFDYLRAVSDGIVTELQWGNAPEIQAWLDQSRLNLLSGLREDEDPVAFGSLQQRFFTAMMPALEKLEVFAAGASPEERARRFRPEPASG
jgi:hypothetical protein